MKSAERVALYSILVKLIFASIKISFAVISQSVALLAESIHAVTDLISTGLVFLGLKISAHKSKTFPYGLYKVENFVALLIALLIFFAGFEILKEVFITPTPTEIGYLLLTILVIGFISILTLLWAQYEIKKAKEFNSPSLLADGRHFKIDFLSSMVVFCGLVGNYRGFNLDRPAAVILVVFIAKAGWEILKDSIKVLLDASFDFNTLDKIKNIIKNHNDVKAIKSLSGRNSGSFKFVEAEIELEVKDLKKAHSICDRIEASIKKEVSDVDKVMIHYEPLIKRTITYAVPIEDNEGKISDHFGKAPYIFLLKINRDNRNIIEKEIINNPYSSLDRQKGIKLAELLTSKNLDVLILREKLNGKGSGYVLQNEGIDIIQTERNVLEEVMTDFFSKILTNDKAHLPL